MTQSIVIADAFAARPFSGNPAAVCVLAGPRDADWMQAVAAEMNLSETAFVYPEEDAFRLRWFTPTMEVDLCGHATLAAAHVLWSEGHLTENVSAQFNTKSGRLTATRSGEWIELDFPAERGAEIAAHDDLLPALGARPVFVGQNRMDVLVEVESEEIVRSLKPDIQRVMNIPARGVIVTARGETGEHDFVSRFFAPNCGVNEDPVCGSAHCFLTPYWSDKLGKTELLAYQASKRGGLLRVRLDGERVKLGGQVFTTMRGELTV